MPLSMSHSVIFHTCFESWEGRGHELLNSSAVPYLITFSFVFLCFPFLHFSLHLHPHHRPTFLGPRRLHAYPPTSTNIQFLRTSVDSTRVYLAWMVFGLVPYIGFFLTFWSPKRDIGYAHGEYLDMV